MLPKSATKPCLDQVVHYERLEHKLTTAPRTMYDPSGRVWQVVLRNVNEALDETSSLYVLVDDTVTAGSTLADL